MDEKLIALKEKIHERRARLLGHQYQSRDHLYMYHQHLAECDIVGREIRALERSLADAIGKKVAR